MYKYLLESVDGIEWFGISSLVLFFTVFCIAAIRAILSNKADMDYMANLPFEE
ncbi:MAG: hypothetical protein IPL65_17305 [Lewinellaceae bacterium]|nr:hypothetical protein [Lewinellaceae bacterium]